MDIIPDHLLVRDYAPIVPIILLPNNFSSTKTTLRIYENIEDISNNSQEIVNFTRNARYGSTFSGTYRPNDEDNTECAFRISVYRHLDINNGNVIECQRTGGDRDLYNNFYQIFKTSLENMQ